jgi:hypothetical protein
MMKFFHLPWTLGIWVCRFADWVRFLPFAKSGTAAVAAKHFKLRDYKAHNWLQEHTHSFDFAEGVLITPTYRGGGLCSL